MESGLLGRLVRAVRTFEEEMVVNVSPLFAPCKAAAVHDLVAACAALFAGDDVNDESAFTAAPRQWLTIRVGNNCPQSRARYFINHPQEMARLIDRMMSILNVPRSA